MLVHHSSLHHHSLRSIHIKLLSCSVESMHPFKNSIIFSMMSELNVKIKVWTLYNHNSNPVERFHKIVWSCLKAKKANRDSYFPLSKECGPLSQQLPESQFGGAHSLVAHVISYRGVASVMQEVNKIKTPSLFPAQLKEGSCMRII